MSEKPQNFSLPAKSLWLLAALLGLIVLVVFTGPLWRSLLISALIAYLLNPALIQLQKRLRLSRTVATVILFLLLLLLAAAIIYGVSSSIATQLPEWSQELRQAWSEILLLLERPFTILNFTIRPQVLLEYLQTAASNAATSLPASSGGWLGGLADNLIWSVVILVSLYYLLRDGQNIVPGLISLLPETYQPRAKAFADDLDSTWRTFLRAQIIIFLVLSVLVVVSTVLILWLFRRGWLPLSPFGLVLLLIVVYTAIQQVDNLWLRPQFMGQALKLHPGVVIVSLLAALAFTGVLGALLIVPVLASLKLLFQHFRSYAVAQLDLSDELTNSLEQIANEPINEVDEAL